MEPKFENRPNDIKKPEEQQTTRQRLMNEEREQDVEEALAFGWTPEELKNVKVLSFGKTNEEDIFYEFEVEHKGHRISGSMEDSGKVVYLSIDDVSFESGAVSHVEDGNNKLIQVYKKYLSAARLVYRDSGEQEEQPDRYDYYSFNSDGKPIGHGERHSFIKPSTYEESAKTKVDNSPELREEERKEGGDRRNLEEENAIRVLGELL